MPGRLLYPAGLVVLFLLSPLACMPSKATPVQTFSSYPFGCASLKDNHLILRTSEGRYTHVIYMISLLAAYCRVTPSLTTPLLYPFSCRCHPTLPQAGKLKPQTAARGLRPSSGGTSPRVLVHPPCFASSLVIACFAHSTDCSASSRSRPPSAGQKTAAAHLPPSSVKHH